MSADARAEAERRRIRLESKTNGTVEAFVEGAEWQASRPATDAEIEELCEVMHDTYEQAAVSEGWETQERSRKPWADVPEANKRTMRVAVRAVLEAVREVRS